MSKRDQRLFLDDILDAIDKIKTYTAQMSYDEFKEKQMPKDAVFRNLEIIGDAVKNIKDEIKLEHKEVDWKAIAGMRDKITHGYFGIDTKVVWQTIQNKLPELKTQIQKILEEEDLKYSS